MSFIVLTRFADLQDSNRIYEAGESYPRPGFVVSTERLSELSGSDNRVGKPLIAEAIEAPEKAIETPQNTDKEIPVKSAETPKRGRRSRKKE